MHSLSAPNDTAPFAYYFIKHIDAPALVCDAKLKLLKFKQTCVNSRIEGASQVEITCRWRHLHGNISGQLETMYQIVRYHSYINKLFSYPDWAPWGPCRFTWRIRRLSWITQDNVKYTHSGRLFSTPVSCVTYKPPAFTVESAEPRLNNKVLTSTRIPKRFRGLYRLHP